MLLGIDTGGAKAQVWLGDAMGNLHHMWGTGVEPDGGPTGIPDWLRADMPEALRASALAQWRRLWSVLTAAS